MQFLLFWFMRPRFGVFSLACIIAALLITPIYGVILAASAIVIETVFQNAYKQAFLIHMSKDYIEF